MNWIKSIFKWLGAGSPKKPNVTDFTAKTWEQASAYAKLHPNAKLVHREWVQGVYVKWTGESFYMFSPLGMLTVWEPSTSEQYGGNAWDIIEGD